jgi:MOSC domain-containing protein YiiM
MEGELAGGARSGGPRVVSLNVSKGGVPKLAVAAAHVGVAGMSGDCQRNLKYHGGPDRALCLYSLEAIEALAAEGHPIGVGTTGENVTLAGIEWTGVAPGVRLRLGPEVVIEVTAYTKPCRTIQGSFAGRRFGRISEKANPGWSRVYARVIVGGLVQVGDPVSLEGSVVGAVSILK